MVQGPDLVSRFILLPIQSSPQACLLGIKLQTSDFPTEFLISEILVLRCSVSWRLVFVVFIEYSAVTASWSEFHRQYDSAFPSPMSSFLSATFDLF